MSGWWWWWSWWWWRVLWQQKREGYKPLIISFSAEVPKVVAM